MDRLTFRTANKYNNSDSEDIAYKQSISGKEIRNTSKNKTGDCVKED